VSERDRDRSAGELPNPTFRRGEAVRRKVLAATIASLIEDGYAATTVESIATRAGVHKTTIYRRWTTRERLVVEALAERVGADIPLPDTGAIEVDLRELARRFVRWATSADGSAMIATMVTAGAEGEEIARARRDFFASRFRQAAIVIDRAIAREEIPVGTTPASVLRMMLAPLYFRLLIVPEPLTEDAADEAAAIALLAARNGLLVSR
jgi:AcrR family transcriptional regulator